MKFRSLTHKVSEILYKVPGGTKRRKSGVIITAAGNGIRMGNIAKHFIPINGKPAIYYSISAFENSANVDEIVIVTRECDVEKMKEIVEEYGFKKVKKFVLGGGSRDESVKNGFEVLSDTLQYVAIHDGARPLITTDKIDFVFREAYKFGAACAAAKIHDTVKKISSRGHIEKTLPRDELYAAQTPQIFACDIYRVALALHLKEENQVTDDCSMAENAGFKIKLCDIEIPNVKLTVPQDFDIIEAIISKRGVKA